MSRRVRGALWSLKVARPGSQGWVVFLLVIAFGLLVILGVIFAELSQRRIPVQYAKRMVGRRMFGGTTTYIPIKVNQAGVIPVIFASSLLYLPALYAQFRPGEKISSWISSNFVKGDHPVYLFSFFLLIVFFAYFYVAITFNPNEVADNMKKYGGFIPGIRAGKPTEDYLSFVLSRLTFPGSMYLGLIALLPSIAFILLNANQNFPFGGTSILIIVGVGLDTVKQIESQLQQRNYEGFLR
jgi:preprotein translocase subunit SecY